MLRVLASGQVILGPEVTAFEREAADYCGAAHAVGCGSGTDALSLALVGLGVGPGDEVVMPPFTYGRNAGLRIDHLLLSPSLNKRLTAAGVDKDVRGRDKASYDAPAWIELSATRRRSGVRRMG